MQLFPALFKVFVRKLANGVRHCFLLRFLLQSTGTRLEDFWSEQLWHLYETDFLPHCHLYQLVVCVEFLQHPHKFI